MSAAATNPSTITRPTFINIGPGRCATSWLHEIFLAHPEITMARVKETEFFNHNYDKGLDWYHNQFPQEGKLVAGEISNCYYTEPTIGERILEYSPDMKIIINVREPYALLKSFHGFGIRRGMKLGPLEESLNVPIGKLMASGFEHRQQRNELTTGDRISILDAVMLSNFIKPLLESFPAENVYLFIFERLKTERAQVLQEMYQFIGVNSQFVPPVADEVVNASIQPKSKIIARLATQVAYTLRRLGAFGLLSALHKSRLIKKLFYRETENSKSPQSDPRKILNAATSEMLDQEIADMMQLHPPLKNWWGHLLPSEKSSVVAG